MSKRLPIPVSQMTREQRLEYQRQWRSANRDKVSIYNKRAALRKPRSKEYSRLYSRKWRAKNMDKLRAYWAANRERIRKNRLANYYKHRNKISAQRREEYRKNPQPAKDRAREWRQKNHRRSLENKRQYYYANQAKLIKYSREWYYKNHEVIKAKMAAFRARKRQELRERSKKRTASLCDSYIREQLAKGSPCSTKDFPQELVELKRQQMIARKELQKYEKHERTARYSL